MDKRQARLEEEYRTLMDLCSRSELIHIEPVEGNPPKRYRIGFRCRGIMLHPETGSPCVTVNHLMEIYLPSKYPNERPERRWLTPIFHPNINKNGAVCLGDDWAPSMTLSWLVEQLADYITYRAYNLDDPYYKEAAIWARENLDKFPIDSRPLFKPANTASLDDHSNAVTSEPVKVVLEEEETRGKAKPRKKASSAKKANSAAGKPMKRKGQKPGSLKSAGQQEK